MRKIFLVSSSDTKISSNKLIVNISSILFKSTNNKAMKSVSTHGCLTIAKTSCKKVFRISWSILSEKASLFWINLIIKMNSLRIWISKNVIIWTLCKRLCMINQTLVEALHGSQLNIKFYFTNNFSSCKQMWKGKFFRKKTLFIEASCSLVS